MSITLRSDALEVHVTPGRGADLVQVVDLATGTPLLAESPTGRVTAPRMPADSMAAWLNGYPGGWQLLAPNAGPERVHAGGRQGFHGEAALAEWTVLARDEASVECETYLLTAPLRLHRLVRVDGPTVSVTDTIANLSPDPASARLVQHPAFGSTFLDGDSYILTSARTLVTDAGAPGSLASAALVGAPDAVLPGGPVPGSLAVPAPGSGASLFAALTDFVVPEATFVSPKAGFAVTLEWDAGVLPHAWLWMEANAGSGWPWFRRLYAVAIEPANLLPGDGAIGDHTRGGPGVELAPDEQVTFTTRLTRRVIPA